MKKDQTKNEEEKEIVVLDRGVPLDEDDGPLAFCCRITTMPYRV